MLLQPKVEYPIRTDEASHKTWAAEGGFPDSNLWLIRIKYI